MRPTSMPGRAMPFGVEPYPLGVQVEIDLQKRIVWVLNVWRFRRRGE